MIDKNVKPVDEFELTEDDPLEGLVDDTEYDDPYEDLYEEDGPIKNRKFKEERPARMKTRRRQDTDGETLNNLTRTAD
jgi:hypothetical protein